MVVLIDDIGFGASQAFGGPINMPTLDKLAATGLKYNRFHTTALCSPTRMALLTGYNHHSNNAGSIMETSTTFPGNTGVRPQSITPMAEVLRQNGFSTAAFGKYHETPPWEISVSGSLDRWPHILALISSMDLLVEKPINGRRWFMMALHRWRFRKIKIIISLLI